MYEKLFLESLIAEKGYSVNTYNSYKIDLKQLQNFYPSHKVIDLQKDQIYDYLYHLEAKGLSPSAKSRKISCLKQFFKFLTKEKIITKSPMANINFPKQNLKVPKVLDLGEIKKIFDYIDNQIKKSKKGSRAYKSNIQNKAMIEIIYSSGLRVSECINLKRKDFLGQSLKVLGKGNKERIIPLNNHAISAIDDHISCSNPEFWLFPSKKKSNSKMTRQSLNKLLKKIESALLLHKSSLSPHVLRHSFASHIIENGADLISVQKMLGHKNITSTQIYTHVSPNSIKQAVYKKHPFTKKDKI